MKTNFELYRDKIGEWRWRARRAGRIVADGGEGYKRQAACLRSLQRFCNSSRAVRALSLAEVSSKCKDCGGTGRIKEGGTFSKSFKCDVCDGTGVLCAENA